jgi:hypothetical protein
MRLVWWKPSRRKDEGPGGPPDIGFIAYCYERSGGWIGQFKETFRFLDDLDFFFSQRHSVAQAVFTRKWPHHLAGSWYGQQVYSGIVGCQN